MKDITKHNCGSLLLLVASDSPVSDTYSQRMDQPGLLVLGPPDLGLL